MPTRQDTAVDVGTEKQLFIDNRFIDMNEAVRLTMNPPRKTGERLIVCERPWEEWFLAFVSVLKDDDGSYKMWYGACDKYHDAADGAILCYATSTDGICWDKPNLGVMEFKGSRENNIVFRPEGVEMGPGVFNDPTAAPEERYKLMYGDSNIPWKAPAPYGSYGSMCGATSPDGIHWTPLAENPIMPFYKDSQNVVWWDDRVGKYVCYVRANDWSVQPARAATDENDEVTPMARFRRIGRCETDDFRHWPEPTTVFACDDDDPPNTDVYSSAAIHYPHAANVYLMFPSMFYHHHDTVDIQLAVSRDGVAWERAGGRLPFISLGREGEFDSRQLYVAAGITRESDELSMYYCGEDVGHDAHTAEAVKRSTISRAVLRLDGFMSADADYRGGILTTPPLMFAGNQLELNIDTGAGGIAQVEILDVSGQAIKGFSRDEADIINGSDVRKMVTWNRRPELGSLAGKPVRLRVFMRDAKLYAFQFVEAP